MAARQGLYINSRDLHTSGGFGDPWADIAEAASHKYSNGINAHKYGVTHFINALRIFICFWSYSCSTWCTSETAIEPSPTAAATRLRFPERTSPTANTPGRLVSKRYGDRASGQRVVWNLLNIFRFDDQGRLIEEWVQTDYRSFLRQLRAQGK
jgi:hypothetical protein